MTDPTSGAPSEEQLREYLESLRAAQPVEVIVQAFGILATAAEVKLGRDDARTMIDGMTGLIDATASRLTDSIVERMRDTVTQLQMAQVQAERQEAGQPAEPSASEPTAEQAAPGAEPAAPADQGGQESMTSRLWIPGRDG